MPIFDSDNIKGKQQILKTKMSNIEFEFPVTPIIERSVSFFNDISDLCITRLDNHGVIPRILLGNCVSEASLVGDLSTYYPEQFESGIKGIVVSDEFCQKVWCIAYLIVLVADSLGLVQQETDKDALTIRVVYDNTSFEKIITDNYLFIKEILPYLITEKERDDIYKTRSFLITKVICNLSDLDIESFFTAPQFFNLANRITEYGIAFLIGHELTHVFREHSTSIWADRLSQEKEADETAMDEVLRLTPENERIIARYGFIALQMTLLFTRNLKEKVNRYFPDLRTHPDDDDRLFSIFEYSCKDTREKQSICIVIAVMIRIWGKLYHRDELPFMSQDVPLILETLRAYLRSAKI